MVCIKISISEQPSYSPCFTRSVGSTFITCSVVPVCDNLIVRIVSAPCNLLCNGWEGDILCELWVFLAGGVNDIPGFFFNTGQSVSTRERLIDTMWTRHCPNRGRCFPGCLARANLLENKVISEVSKLLVISTCAVEPTDHY